MITKDDLIKIMLGKMDELSHVAPKVFDTFKSKRDTIFGGSSLKMAEQLTKEGLALLSNEEVKTKLHEEFDPIASIEDTLIKNGKIIIDMILSGPRERGFEEFKNSFKGVMVDFVGMAVQELQDGFVDGEEDVFAWVKANVMRYNMIGKAPGDSMMAHIKTAQQVAMAKSAWAEWQAKQEQA